MRYLKRFYERLSTDYQWYEYLTSYAFILVPLLFFLVFTLYPLAWSFILSFQRFRVSGNTWVGLQNYLRLFTGSTASVYLKALKNTIIYTLFTVPIGVAITIGLAVLIYPLPRRVQNLFKGAYYLPSVTSGIVLSLVWLWIFDPLTGLLNYLVGLVGISPQNWLGDPSVALPAVILMALAGGHGSGIILALAAMGSVPRTYYEAADIDAASRWSKFRNITIPLIKPTILYMLIIGMIGSFQVFELIYVLTQGGPMYSTMTLVYLIYQSAFVNFDFGYAAAQAFVLGGIVVLISIIQYKLLATDVEY